MEISGEERIGGSRDEVWQALHNPQVLKEIIPGCKELRKISPTEIATTIKVKIGLLSGSFKNHMTFSDIKAPESYTITTKGGIAKAVTHVTLREEKGKTVVSYTVSAKLTGPFAMFGSKLVQTSSAKLFARFFKRLKEEIADRGSV